MLTFIGLDSGIPAPRPQPGACKVTATTNAWDIVSDRFRDDHPAARRSRAGRASASGFQANHTGSSAAPGAFTLNGPGCAAG